MVFVVIIAAAIIVRVIIKPGRKPIYLDLKGLRRGD